MAGTGLRVVIADDEQHGRERMRTLLDAAPDVTVLRECADGEAASRAVRELRPDVLVLAVPSPGQDALEVLELEPGLAPATIVVTAGGEHAARAFEVNAVDYLLKPVGAERFGAALDRARTVVRHRRGEGLEARLEALVRSLAAREPFPDRFLVKAGAEYVFVRAADVDWIEAADNYVVLHAGDRKHMVRTSLSAFQKQLSPRRFLRIHRSAVVNLDRVRAIRPYSGVEYEVVLICGRTLLTGRRYREHVRASLFG